jgi:GNAT superfamily N-acetyltransferase
MIDLPNLFTIAGYHIAQIQEPDLGELQALLESCSDYSLMVAGHPPDPSDAASLMLECPPGKILADKFVIGISVEKKGLVGVLDAVREYPTQGDWWLGLLLLAPSQRNQGLGKRIYQAFEHWVGQQGTRRVFLGVLEENQKAYQFWQRMGFELIEKRPPTQFGNLNHVVLTMARNLTEV